jgi:CubicO group peptidase (beta-lactamase class C family)
MKLLLKLFAVLLVFQRLTPCATGAASIDVSQILEAYSGVGLTAWSVNGEGNLCSIGSAGERIKGSGEEFIVTGDSRHHIGSVTKGMTAVLLAILMNDGTIPNGWDTLLQSILPMATNTAYENVTLRELCGMLSGIPPNPPNPFYYQQMEPTDLRAQRRIAAADALKSLPVHTPGSAFNYSNWGFIVAGHIVEELTDLTWEDNIKTRLFSPLGITLGDATDFTGAPNNNVDPWGHSGVNENPCNPATSPTMCDLPRVYGPAGTFSGPLAAMAKYFAWHLACHNGSYSNDMASTEKNLLPQKACRELHQAANASLAEYGYGWLTEPPGWVAHDGSNLLNYYFVGLSFDIDRAFVAFTNGALSVQNNTLMVHEALNATINGEQDCQDRIPSDAYTTPLQNVTGGSASGIDSMAALYGSIFVGMMLLLW